MKEMIHTSNFKRLFFFWSGIIATFAYRAIIILDKVWTQIAWYVGTVGFILYFGHRAYVQKKRSLMVINNNLVEVVDNLKLKKNQKDALIYLVKTAKTSKARFNSLFIFWLSVIALIVGIIFDFIL